MVRRVFLVGAPLDDYGSSFYRGVEFDVNNYYNFFLSPTGGAYHDSEIIYLKNPSQKGLFRCLRDNPADYAIFVFTGHGYFSENKRLNVFNINSLERASVKAILQHLSAPKRILISDTCRVCIRDEYEYIQGIGDPGMYMQFPSYLNSEQSRYLYNTAIACSTPGTQILYSCKPGEASIITTEGSVFTNSLLKSINNWTRDLKDFCVLKGVNAFKHSSSYMRSAFNVNQTPMFKVSQPNLSFPLAVKYGLSQ